MKHWNRQFGEFEYDEMHVIHFPRGIIGFESYKQFVVVADDETHPFCWLISVEDEDLSFPMLHLEAMNSYYKTKLDRSDDVTVYVVASLRPNVNESTINLRSPIVIDEKSRTGEQVILPDERLSMRYPLAHEKSIPVEG